MLSVDIVAIRHDVAITSSEVSFGRIVEGDYPPRRLHEIVLCSAKTSLAHDFTDAYA